MNKYKLFCWQYCGQEKHRLGEVAFEFTCRNDNDARVHVVTMIQKKNNDPKDRTSWSGEKLTYKPLRLQAEYSLIRGSKFRWICLDDPGYLYRIYFSGSNEAGGFSGTEEFESHSEKEAWEYFDEFMKVNHRCNSAWSVLARVYQEEITHKIPREVNVLKR